MKVGIVGAGIMGRLLAWQLAKQGDHVTLFERDKIQRFKSNGHAAAYTAAGMLTPISEADGAEETIVELGQHSLTLWPKLVDQLQADVDFNRHGSLILAHTNDYSDLLNFRQHLARMPRTHSFVKHINRDELTQFDEGLAQKFTNGTFIEGEAWVSPQLLLPVLANELIELGAELIEQVSITHVSSGCIASESKRWQFDKVVDCRGLGAKQDIKDLRGVRGEVIWLFAPEVQLKHIVRLMHPRYRIYIVPRANNVYVIGATQIESANQQPITVRSALELLSAAYSVHPGFAEANIIDTRANCRPALPDNLPQFIQDKDLLRINGLFRHGILLAPALAQMAVHILKPETSLDEELTPFLNTLVSTNKNKEIEELDIPLHESADE